VSAPEAIAANLASVRRRIASAAERSGRDSASITLVAVTKTVGAEAIAAAIAAGVRDLGENYVSELRTKREAIDALDVRWHHIGPLQSSTAARVAVLADVVHGVAGEHAAAKLALRAVREGRSVDALIEVDFTGSRSGVSPEEVAGLADRIARLDGLRLCGLMTIAPLSDDPEDARPCFRRLRQLRDGVAEIHPDVLELSMGMSLDYEVAVQEGATMVRIGTAVFGARAP
jgi:hypothetical protein